MEASPNNPYLSHEAISALPEKWFYQINKFALRCRVIHEKDIISKKSTPEEIYNLQTKVFAGILDLPKEFANTNHFGFILSSNQMKGMLLKYFGFLCNPKSPFELGKEFKIPSETVSEIINNFVRKLDNYIPERFGFDLDYAVLEEKHEKYLDLANAFAINVKIDKDNLTVDELTNRLSELLIEIKRVIDYADDDLFKAGDHSPSPQVLRQMLYDRLGLKDIMTPCFTNVELAKKYQLSSTHLANNLIGKVVNNLRRYYKTFVPQPIPVN